MKPLLLLSAAALNLATPSLASARGWGGGHGGGWSDGRHDGGGRHDHWYGYRFRPYGYYGYGGYG